MSEIEASTATISEQVKNIGGRPKGSKDSPNAKRQRVNRKVFELAAKNVPIPAIAKTVGLSTTSIKTRLRDLREALESVDKLEDWEMNKADYFSAAQHTLLKSMLSQDKLDKASVNNLAYALTQVHTAGRLERGQSTANVATQVTRFTRHADVDDR